MKENEVYLLAQLHHRIGMTKILLLESIREKVKQTIDNKHRILKINEIIDEKTDIMSVSTIDNLASLIYDSLPTRNDERDRITRLINLYRSEINIQQHYEKELSQSDEGLEFLSTIKKMRDLGLNNY